ncbi:Putative Spermine/spermidine synthase family protein (AFU_orthologue; AFUA_5G08500) [Aspergillus calidoustus]|uniref:Putative Spermine/spermidine synthase family protein (AFU_orthologue AFUA_5G08500) n=1 Tax=Aspergillus calidoustus TaxID=454130 RepID=A0A0U5FTS8_ASPCI|nr:Putative Spermine/spermidine synthase family protein (AFU_orthologue; AFUA_5G08500) [Aspergillus calidoustus]
MAPFRSIYQQDSKKQLAVGVALLVLAAFYSFVFLLTLAPVYGSAPSHIFHNYGVAIAGAAGWFAKDHIHRLSDRRAVYLIPVLASWLPILQYFLAQQSSSLGNPAGPVITELFALYPLVLLCVACAGKLVQSGLDLSRHGDLVAEHIPLLGSYIVYSAGEHLIKAFLSKFIGSTVFLSRAGLQILIAIFYAVAVPSKLLLLVIPSLLFSGTSNVHLTFGYSTRALNSVISEEGFALVARQDSTTGYISVLDNLVDGFRVMRCDHSLLGGQWIKARPNYTPPTVKDPIYAVFAMLEAVRLVETVHGGPRVDTDSKALVIGLGIGTTPGALISHGIDTTIVEIDPVVHKFASQHFGLPSNHTAVIEDARTFVNHAQTQGSVQYDYIVHDVFTGGAEPVELFTYEFISGLSALLKDDGVIAINYAGDLTLYPASLAVRTIKSIFPTCRLYREEATSEVGPDFTNMVIFCTKSSSQAITFRDAVPADFLGSRFRSRYLVPKHEIDAARFAAVEQGGRAILYDKEVNRLHKYQDRGALEHWGIMRTVLPDAVWEAW